MATSPPLLRKTQMPSAVGRSGHHQAKVDVSEVSDDQLRQAVDAACVPPESAEEQETWLRQWDPVDLLVPEWRYLLKDPLGLRHEDEASGLTLSKRDRDPQLRPEITRVLAVERLRKVNAIVGFTRIDDMDRVGDLPQRRAIEGARSSPTTATPLWTMPGHLARSGPLTSSASHLVDGARQSVTCSTFNFQRSSGLWAALRQAAQRSAAPGGCRAGLPRQRGGRPASAWTWPDLLDS